MRSPDLLYFALFLIQAHLARRLLSNNDLLDQEVISITNGRGTYDIR